MRTILGLCLSFLLWTPVISAQSGSAQSAEELEKVVALLNGRIKKLEDAPKPTPIVTPTPVNPLNSCQWQSSKVNSTGPSIDAPSECAAGKRLMAGGCQVANSFVGKVHLVTNRRIPSSTSTERWVCAANAEGSTGYDIWVSILCC